MLKTTTPNTLKSLHQISKFVHNTNRSTVVCFKEHWVGNIICYAVILSLFGSLTNASSALFNIPEWSQECA